MTVTLVVAPSEPLGISWDSDPGAVEAWRCGWDIRDPNNDAEWEQNWSATSRSVPTKTFSGTGTHRFFLEARGTDCAVAHVYLDFEVRPVGVQASSWTDAKTRYRTGAPVLGMIATRRAR